MLSSLVKVSKILVEPQPPNWQGVVVQSCKKCLPTGDLRQKSVSDIEDPLCNRDVDIPVEHGVKRGDFVDTHGRDFKKTSHFIHDRDRGEAELSLSKIQQRHDGTFFVLRRILLQDFFHTLLVVRIEFKLELRVVLGCIAMLGRVTSAVEDSV